MAENKNGYTQSQITTMQQDAVRRVNEMQRIARERLGNSTSSPTNQSHSNHPNSSPKANHVEEKIEHIEAEVVQNGFKGLLDRLDLDQEKIIVIMLLILLVNEGADIMLILALVYILL